MSKVTDIKTRTAWSCMKEEETHRAGARLLEALLISANERGLQLQELAGELGVSYGYIAQLRSGVREVPNVSDNFLTSCAEFLALPKVAVYGLAGILSLKDFLPPGNSLEVMVGKGLRRIHEDARFAGMLPAALFNTDLGVQAFVVMLYGHVVGKDMLGIEDLLAESLSK